MMASVHPAPAHTRNDSGISVHSVTQNGPPSPTLTNPDMILPRTPWQHQHQHEARGSSPLASSPMLDPDLALSRNVSGTSSQRDSGGAAELGVATAVYMPSRVTAPPPTAINRPSTPPGGLYAGYEHGAPLSDIYEESEATPKSSKASHVSRTPSPSPSLDRPTTPTKNGGPVLRHKKRLSSLSASSNGSDIGDWEAFDGSKVLSDRVAADIAKMNREEMLDPEEVASRRTSKEEEELAVLNARAEKILENARKRLTHMEGNLKVARNSILMPSRSSPHLGGDPQPVGGLYRSISAAGATRLGKSKPLYPPIKTNPNLRHVRGESESAVPPKQMQRETPEIRSASALEFNLPFHIAQSPEVGSSPTTRFQHSPSSSHSVNSTLRPLEEERETPSTTETTPEHPKMPPPRGLGLHKSASISRENLSSTLERSSSSSRRTPTPNNLQRSSSSASTRSTKELREQMSDLKSRIADLKSQAQKDNLRRRSLQNMQVPPQPDQWYSSTTAYKDSSGGTVNANAGVGSKNEAAHRRVASDGRADATRHLTTPKNNKFLDVERLTPGGESALLSSARTDRNTPSLSRPGHVETDSVIGELDEQDAQSIKQLSNYEDAPGFQNTQDGEEGEEEQIAENEEEQIYLNEVLEESLREAEVEPEVPVIPASFLKSPEGALMPEAERHEDRLDAFDYENMFLHSAMGNYRGRPLDEHESDSESEEEEDEEEGEEEEVEDEDDDDDSVETSRADMRTPTNHRRVEDEEDDGSEPSTDDEMEDVIATGKSPGFSTKGTPKAKKSKIQERQLQSPPKMKLPQPPKPWMEHTRSNSVDSISTAASFATATEGENDREVDDEPHEILNWGNVPRNVTPPKPAQYGYAFHQGQNISPRKHVVGDHAFPSPPSSAGRDTAGRDTPTQMSTNMQQQTRNPTSPLKNAFASDKGYSGVRDMNGFPVGPGLGLGVVGAENAQYINDNGVPERFQGQPSPSHSRQGSKQSNTSTGTKIPSGSKHQRDVSHTSNHSRQYSAGQSYSPSMPVPPSPTRKFVINQSLRSPQMESSTTPPLPNSKSHHKQSSSIQSYSSGSARGTPLPTPLSYSRPHTATSKPGTPSQQAYAQAAPNTEILMESLIKLAQPSFALTEGTRFADMDKDLVLGLLRALGGVCDGLLKAQLRGSKEREQIIGDLRERLEGATGVLDGNMAINWDANEVYGLTGEESGNGDDQEGEMF